MVSPTASASAAGAPGRGWLVRRAAASPAGASDLLAPAASGRAAGRSPSAAAAEANEMISSTGQARRTGLGHVGGSGAEVAGRMAHPWLEGVVLGGRGPAERRRGE